MEMDIPNDSGNLLHWNYLLALEQDLSNISRYIEFTSENFKTYSVELVHLLLASSSEVDVVLKLLSNSLNDGKQHRNINDYRNTVQSKAPNLITETCYIPKFGLTFTPFEEWNEGDNLAWWKSYNGVKHERNENFPKANLENALKSICALGINCLYYYSKLFHSQLSEDDIFSTISKLKPLPSMISFNSKYMVRLI